MFSKKLFQAILISIFFAISNQFNLLAQEKQNEHISKVNVTMIASQGPFSDLENSVLKIFRNALQEKQLLSINGNDFDTELLLNVKELKIKDDNKLILSTVVLNVLPSEVVKLGENAEAFYSMLNEEQKSNLPKEGAFIRKYVSSEYMKQFRMVWDNYLEVINFSELDNFSKNFVSKYFRS